MRDIVITNAFEGKIPLMEAVYELEKGKKIAGRGEGIYVDDVLIEDYTKYETKLAEMQAEYDLRGYARNRENEYPSIQDLVVALYDTDDKSAIEAKRAAVKLKYPKP